MACGCFAAANTAPEGVEAPFLYVENGDPVSLSHAEAIVSYLIETIWLHTPHTWTGVSEWWMSTSTPWSL